LNFRPSDLGISGPIYLYNYVDGTGMTVQPGAQVNESIETGWIYQVAAPIGLSGIAVIGDTGQFVTLGKQRITQLTDDGAVHVTVSFANGETTRTIEGYSPATPSIYSESGSLGTMVYDPHTMRFKVPVIASPQGVATIRISLNRPEALTPSTPGRNRQRN
jgi:hypothetical protein